MDVLYLIESFKDEIIKATQSLISIKSIQGTPEPNMPFGLGPHLALSYSLELAESLGFTTKNVDGYAGYAEYGYGEDTVGVLVHVDVVPAGGGWTYPPFEGEIHKGRIFGRGAVDDKGPAVAVLYALKAIKESGIRLNKKIRIFFGADEETSFLGIKYYFLKEKEFDIGFTADGNFPVINGEKGILVIKLKKQFTKQILNDIRIKSINGGDAVNRVPDFCTAVLEIADAKETFIKERAEGFNKKYGHCLKVNFDKNCREVFLEVNGKSSHASIPEDGINAISMMLLFLNKVGMTSQELDDFIKIYYEKIRLEYHGASIGCGFSDELSGKLTFNVGVIDYNTEGVEVTIDIRYPVKTKVGEVLDGIKNDLKGTGITVEQVDHEQPIYFPEGYFWVQKLLKVYAEVTNDHKSRPIIIGGGTYARAAKNIIAFGPVFPGEEELAHQKDEYISIDNLMKITQIYAMALLELAK